jgi:hypothetical protein
MIPEDVVRFLDGATVGFGATRDARLVPQIYSIIGWTVGDDRETITCLFPAFHSKVLGPSLEDNGRFAFTVLGSTTGIRASQPPNPAVDFHECYQLKGNYVRSRPANEGDVRVVKEKGERFKELFQPLFDFSDAACKALFREPILAMTFKVQEIYDQTPGPGAGGKIRLEEG